MSLVSIAASGPLPQADARLVDTAALEAALRASLEGEVRFDKVSRALYSTDASVYQIEPLGVVVPQIARGLVRAGQICRSSAARSRCAAAARRRPDRRSARASGRHLEVLNECSKSTPPNAGLRVEPGIVLDELNAHAEAARPALRARHLHREPRHHRRHDGQQLERRALGPPRQDDRPRARAASRAVRRHRSSTSGRSTRRAGGGLRRQTRSKRDCYRDGRRSGARARRRNRAPLSQGPAPRRRLQPRRVRRPGEPFNLAKTDRRLRRDARRRARSEARAGAAAEGQGGAGHSVRRPARRAGGDAG